MKERLLLHSCCAPCTTHVYLTLLSDFDITLLFYNPNIEPEPEYTKRKNEIGKLSQVTGEYIELKILDCKYDNKRFRNIVKDLRGEPEGGKRCVRCFEMRLKETAMRASEPYKGLHKFDAFATTLSVSPHKNRGALNEIGDRLSKEFSIKFIDRDYRSGGGYKRSVELAKGLGVYRQNYCGCRKD